MSLSVRRGEIHALIGENGAGKSTLIKTCSGAIEPSEGEITINGKTFKSMTPRLSEENGIGVIYQAVSYTHLYEPNQENFKLYTKLYSIYKDFSEMMGNSNREIMRRLHELQTE